MDTIDMQIVALLRANARMPLKTLAAKVELARSTVRERLVRLEKTGVILGYHARVADVDRLSALLRRSSNAETLYSNACVPLVR